MTTGGELVITARRFRTQEANREDARARLAEMIADCPYCPGQAQADPADAGGQGEARRREEGPQRGQGRARESEAGLMYDFKIEAADKATLYRRPRLGARGAGRGRAGRHRQHGQCRGADLGDAARHQLGRLLPQCRRRAGARAVPGPPGLHPHPVRQGRVRRGGGDAARSSGSRTSTPSPATSPATAHRTAKSSCRSSATANCSACSTSTARSMARFDAEDEAGCVRLGEILARAI